MVTAELRNRVVKTGVLIVSEAGDAVTLMDPPGWAGGVIVKSSNGVTVPAVPGRLPQTWSWPTHVGVTYTVNFAA